MLDSTPGADEPADGTFVDLVEVAGDPGFLGGGDCAEKLQGAVGQPARPAVGDCGVDPFRRIGDTSSWPVHRLGLTRSALQGGTPSDGEMPGYAVELVVASDSRPPARMANPSPYAQLDVSHAINVHSSRLTTLV